MIDYEVMIDRERECFIVKGSDVYKRQVLIFTLISPCSRSYRFDILANRASSILPATLSS